MSPRRRSVSGPLHPRAKNMPRNRLGEVGLACLHGCNSADLSSLRPPKGRPLSASLPVRSRTEGTAAPRVCRDQPLRCRRRRSGPLRAARGRAGLGPDHAEDRTGGAGCARALAQERENYRHRSRAGERERHEGGGSAVEPGAGRAGGPVDDPRSSERQRTSTLVRSTRSAM